MYLQGSRLGRLKTGQKRRWLGSARHTAAALLLFATLSLGSGGAAASGCTPGTGIWCQDPFAFTDPYTSLTWVDISATTAAVDTSGSGTVTLPAGPGVLALDPARSVGVIGTPSGLQGWAFQGGGMQRAPQYDLPGSGYLGAAWLHRGGSLLATLTATQLALQAWTGSGWSQLGALALSDGNSVAPGPGLAGAPASVLVGTTTGFEVVAYQGGVLGVVAGAGIGGFTDAAGLAATQDGSMAAVWAGGSLAVYAWDGAGYVETPTWEPPAGSQRILDVTWMHDGGGYWVLTANGTLTGYAFNGSFVVAVSELSTKLPLPVMALGTGWRQGDLAVEVPSGWNYYDGAPTAFDAARSVTGQNLPAYLPSAVLQSVPLAVGHTVNQVRIEATIDALPPGTALAFQVSATGCSGWQAIALDTNLTVPPGDTLCYRVTLSSTDPTATPVLDATDLYEIATVITTSSTTPDVLIK